MFLDIEGNIEELERERFNKEIFNLKNEIKGVIKALKEHIYELSNEFYK